MNTTSSFRRVSAFLTLAVFLATPASPQGFKWWQSDQYIRELGLTSDQSKRIEEIFQSFVPELKAQKRTLDKAEAEFDALIDSGSDTAVMEQLNQMETARAELSKTRWLMLLKMKNVLLKDQWVKFNALNHQAAQRQAARPQPASPK
jgi:Spy/CpxP family protein refolding chaperone